MTDFHSFGAEFPPLQTRFSVDPILNFDIAAEDHSGFPETDAHGCADIVVTLTVEFANEPSVLVQALGEILLVSLNVVTPRCYRLNLQIFVHAYWQRVERLHVAQKEKIANL